MEPLHVQTPLWESPLLRKRLGKNIFLKMDCFQPTGAFKTRGISRLCQEHLKNGVTHIVSSSGGNAGLAAAYAARKLGLKATVFVPTITRQLFIDRIEAQGATVIVHGDDFSQSAVRAKEFMTEQSEKCGFVPPFDHPAIWTGHSTIVDELVHEMNKPDAIVVAVGGGGLAIGIMDGLHRHGWEDVPLYGVETHGCASFAAAIEAGKPVTLDTIDTIATSLGAKRIADKLFEWSKKHSITPITVSDRDAINGVRWFLDDHRVLVEPACGAPMSVVYNQHPALSDKQNILVIVCGGVGINLDILNQYLKEARD